MSEVYVHSTAVMGTVVNIQVIGHGATDDEHAERVAAVDRAAGWFFDLEKRCSRFDPSSELRNLTNHVGQAMPVSAPLYEALHFALAVAEESDGAFDPTVGQKMEAHGFDREHRSGRVTASGIQPRTRVSWQDVHLDSETRSVTLTRPLVLDLGAVVKGLAVDLAARELAPFENFGIDAGGDLYLGGHNAEGAAWTVGIRHPRDETALYETLHVSNLAVCTSGDYERKSAANDGASHIMDARTGEPARALASVTVVAPTAMVADALATAAFALGPQEGLRFLESQGVRGLMITPSLERIETEGRQK